MLIQSKCLKKKLPPRIPYLGKVRKQYGRKQNPGSQRLGKGHAVTLCSVRCAGGRVLEKAGWLRALAAAAAQEAGWIPSSHISSQLLLWRTWCPLLASVGTTHACRCADMRGATHGEELVKGHYRLGQRDGNSRPYAVTALACRSMV